MNEQSEYDIVFAHTVEVLRSTDGRYEFTEGASKDIAELNPDDVLSFLAHLDQER